MHHRNLTHNTQNTTKVLTAQQTNNKYEQKQTCGDLVAVPTHGALPKLLLRVPKTTQFRAAEGAEMLANTALAQSQNQLVAHTLWW